MTADDAVTILTALVSGSVSSQIAAVTSLLLAMPHVGSFSTGRASSGFGLLRNPSPFYKAGRTSTLRQGMTAVLEETWAKDAEFDEDGNERYPGYDSLVDLEALSFTVGMDGRRTGGFAIIRARVTADILMTRFYSTWPMRISPGADTVLDPWLAFDSGAGLMTATRVDGPVFGAAANCILKTAPKTRLRIKRFAAT
jgi:hypothetical protein